MSLPVAFPRSEWSNLELAKQAGDLSNCAKGHVAYKPKRGDALLFFDTKPNYQVPSRSCTLNPHSAWSLPHF